MTSPLRTEFVSTLPRPRLRRWASKFLEKFANHKISKFLGSFRYRNYANFFDVPAPQIANPQIFTINPQIANPQIYKLSVLHKKMRTLYAIYVRRKNIYLRTCVRAQVNLRPSPGSGNKRGNEPDEIVVHVGGIPQRSRRHRPVKHENINII
jgi:hypothetical protein